MRRILFTENQRMNRITVEASASLSNYGGGNGTGTEGLK